MKILSVAFNDFSKLYFGVSKKIISECRAFKNLNNETYLIGMEGTNTILINFNDEEKKVVLKKHVQYNIEILKKVFNKINQINDIKKFISNKTFDICYIRYDLSTPKFISLLKKISKHCKKIIIEIPTYPYCEEYKGRLNLLRLKIDKYFAKKLKKYVDLIVSFYNIDNFFGIKCLQVPNGFDFENIKIIDNNNMNDVINIAAVSSMREWHGYERMIEGLYFYYKNGGSRKILFHLVGNGKEYYKYKDLVDKYSLNNHVIFHGSLYGEKLDSLLDNCTLGVDSLARHRNGINILSSLKSREYGAKGLPFINSCKIDIIDDDFKYMFQVPADENPIDITKVVEFHDNIYSNKSRIEIATEIRKYIESKSDMKAVIKKIIDCVAIESD